VALSDRFWIAVCNFVSEFSVLGNFHSETVDEKFIWSSTFAHGR